ncbi:MAG: hypothetical protein WDZ42_02140 [Candidatus Saccharimonadales bacterium]
MIELNIHLRNKKAKKKLKQKIMPTEQNNYNNPEKRTNKTRNALAAGVLAVAASWTGLEIRNELYGDPPELVSVERVEGDDGEVYYIDEEGNQYQSISTWRADPNSQPKTLIGEGVSQRHVQDVLRDNGLKSVPAEPRSYLVNIEYMNNSEAE